MEGVGPRFNCRFVYRWAVAVCLLVAPKAWGQSFLGAGATVSWPAGTSPYVGTQNPSVPSEGIHAVTVGGVAAIGVFPWTHVGVAAELSVPREFTADQVADKYRTHNTHRDLVLSGVLHVRAAHQRIDGVVGLSFVHERTEQQIAHRSFGVPGFPYEPYSSPPESIGRNTFGIVGGVDVPLRAGRYLSVVPQFRAHWIAREDDSTASSPRFLGLSPILWQPRISLRVTF
jgi:hypothetical protein